MQIVHMKNILVTNNIYCYSCHFSCTFFLVSAARLSLMQLFESQGFQLLNLFLHIATGSDHNSQSTKMS